MQSVSFNRFESFGFFSNCGLAEQDVIHPVNKIQEKYSVTEFNRTII